jgi:hypothetical protein
MEIFETTDEELALALITAGAKLAGSDTGVVPPCINHYTPDLCRSRRLLPQSPVSPQVFEKAVIEARERKIPGIVTWRIVKDAEFNRAIKAWDAMVEEMHKAKAENREPNLPDISTETVMQALYMRRLNHKPMKDHIWVVCPSLSLGKASVKVKPIDGVPDEVSAPLSYTAEGAAVFWNLNTTSENREKIGAPKKP